jgi:HlyD family secretion protein
MGRKFLVWTIAVLVLAVGAGCFLFLKKKPEVAYRTAAVERGDIAVQVTASGTLNPHTNVLVGTQVSGTVAKLFVDFNSRVKKGQVVALLDSTLLFAAVQDVRATLGKAEAMSNLSKENCSRTRTLFGKGLVAQSDLDQAISDSASAAATLSSARAQLDRAKINLRYATIVSPIEGIVIARNVDVGQTVAASFNTPTLFTISDDLTKMQVQASIDEADIGQVLVGQTATFTVDAFPARTFKGTVSQIRLQPTTVQNVVTYTVMIDVDNADKALLPGMTANITVEVKKAGNVLTVPAAALKFAPPVAIGKKGRKPQGVGIRDSARAGSSREVRDTSLAQNTQLKKGEAGQERGRVFVLTDGKPVRVPVRTGLSNGGFTAVEGELQPGQLVIVGVISADKNNAAPQQKSPFGGMGGRH